MELRTTHNCKLLFFEKFDTKEKKRTGELDPKTNKRALVETGKIIQKTRYHLLDPESHEKVAFVSIDDSYEKLEGQVVEVLVSVKMNIFANWNENPLITELLALLPIKK